MLVSCIMPTTESRENFVHQAIKYFLRQTYPYKELIIVCDGKSPNIQKHQDIHILQTPGGFKIGKKMNIGVKSARGDILQKWDDDDWYSPNFLETMLSQERLKEISKQEVVGVASDCPVFFVKPWKVLLSKSIAGGTLCFSRETWGKRNFLEDISVGEDKEFIIDRYIKVDSKQLFSLIRHGSNTWKTWESNGTSTNVDDAFLSSSLPQKDPEEILPIEDIGFYRDLRNAP